jgi:hypothetical protein
MAAPHVPAKFWAKSLEFLWYEEVEKVACVSKFFKLFVFDLVARVNFRTTNSLVREVGHVRHFWHGCVNEVFIFAFFAMAQDGDIAFANFALPDKYSDGSRVISSICAYQHVLAVGSLKKVILGQLWDYEMSRDEETGVNVLIPVDDWRLGQAAPNDQDLLLTPADWSDEHEHPNTFLPECTKFDFFLLQLTSAYETSLLSQDVIFEGIPFWHPSHLNCKKCCRCEGVCSFFPLPQITEMSGMANPGFFPYEFNALCMGGYLQMVFDRPDGREFLVSNGNHLLWCLLHKMDIPSLRCWKISYPDPALRSMGMLVGLGATPINHFGWPALAMKVRDESDVILGLSYHDADELSCSAATTSMSPSSFNYLQAIGFARPRAQAG